MSEWLEFCRACVADLDAVLADLPTRAEREPVLRAGEGGDDTTAIDAAAEDVVVRRLEALGRDLTLVSEELGVRAFGAGGAVRVVVDPIDGSVNAKRAIPFFSLSGRGRRRPDHGRRPFRLRLRLRRARGVGRRSAAGARS